MKLRATAMVWCFIFGALGHAWAQIATLPQGPREKALLEAVLLSQAPKVKDLLDQGASTEARHPENEGTALFFAAEKGNVEIVRLLLDRGANVNAVEKLHRESPVSAAARGGHAEVVRLLLAKDDSRAPSVAANAVYQNSPAALDVATATGRLTAEDLSLALELAERQGSADVAAHLRKSGVPTLAAAITLPAATLTRYSGLYRAEDSTLTLSLKDGSLFAAFGNSDPTRLAALEPTYFTAAEGPVAFRVRFEANDGRVTGVSSRHLGDSGHFKRVE